MAVTRKEIEEAKDGIRPENKINENVLTVGETGTTYASIYEKLQSVRVAIAKASLKKGGKNKFAGYSYYELPDFLPQSNSAMLAYRLTPVFNLYKEYAELIIYDWDSDMTIKFRTDNADATTLKKDGKTPANLEIQTLGSQHTYLKRYLYMNALELSESDGLEANTGNEEFVPNEPEKVTGYQIKRTLELFDDERIEAMLTAYEVKDITEMKKDDLEKIIIIREKQIKKELEEEENNKEKKAEEEKEVLRLDDLI